MLLQIDTSPHLHQVIMSKLRSYQIWYFLLAFYQKFIYRQVNPCDWRHIIIIERQLTGGPANRCKKIDQFIYRSRLEKRWCYWSDSISSSLCRVACQFHCVSLTVWTDMCNHFKTFSSRGYPFFKNRLTLVNSQRRKFTSRTTHKYPFYRSWCYPISIFINNR